MENQLKSGAFMAVAIRVANQDAVKKLKDNAKKANTFSPYESDNLVFETMQDKSIIYLCQKENQMNMQLAMIRPEDLSPENISPKLKSDYGDFISYDELIEFHDRCEISIVGLAPGGKAVIGMVNELEEPVVIEVSEDVRYSTSEDLEKEIVDAGILPQTDLDERIAYLEMHGITIKDTPILYIGVLKKIHQQDANIEKPKKLYVPNTSGESLIKRICRNIVLGDPVILEGPKSVGKNVAWESVSWLLNRPMEVLNCSARMTRADMFGSPSTDNSAKDRLSLDGAKSFIKSLFAKKEDENAAIFLKNIAECMSPSIKLEKGPVTRAIMAAGKEGTILIADELNLSDPNTFSGAFNGLTDKHTTEYNIAGIGVIKLSDDLIIGGTQNGTGGAYVGTKVQNQATMSRFNVIRIDAPGSIAKILKENRHIESINGITGLTTVNAGNKASGLKLTRKQKPETKFDYGQYKDICKKLGQIEEKMDAIYKDFSDSVESGEVTEDALNVRGFERALSHVLMGQSLKDSVCECVINTCSEDMRLTLETFVDNIGSI